MSGKVLPLGRHRAPPPSGPRRREGPSPPAFGAAARSKSGQGPCASILHRMLERRTHSEARPSAPAAYCSTPAISCLLGFGFATCYERSYIFIRYFVLKPYGPPQRLLERRNHP